MGRRRLLLVLGTLLPFGVGEAYLQVLDPFYFREREDWGQYVAAVIDPETRGLREDAMATYLGKPTVISSQGWRSPIFAVEKPDGVYRILLLGGSVAYGWGVAQGDEYPRVLEKMLNDADRVPGKRIEIINTGVPGWSLAQEGRLLSRVVSLWKPDLVLLTLVATDARGPAAGGKREFFLNETIRRLRLARALEYRYVFGNPGQAEAYDSYAEERISGEGLQAVAVALGLFASAWVVYLVSLRPQRIRRSPLRELVLLSLMLFMRGSWSLC